MIGNRDGVRRLYLNDHRQHHGAARGFLEEEQAEFVAQGLADVLDIDRVHLCRHFFYDAACDTARFIQ